MESLTSILKSKLLITVIWISYKILSIYFDFL